MRANVQSAGGKVTIGLTVYPPYPDKYFANPCCNHSYSYQNAGDWSWFGGRMVQALVSNGMIQDAVTEIEPMLARVISAGGFWEWWDQENQPSGSAKFRGSAGVLGKAIEMLQSWADEHLQKIQ